jgi:hypothetical protein
VIDHALQCCYSFMMVDWIWIPIFLYCAVGI